MMKSLLSLQKTIFIVLCFLSSMMAFSQMKSHPLERVEQLQKIEQKNVVVFLHTDWCNYCKAMQSKTFKDKNVQQLLSEKFYFADLNGEEKEEINFAGSVFRFHPTGFKTGYHELAASLGNIEGQVSYPTLVILNPENEIIFQYNGFMSVNQIVGVLQKIEKG